MDGSRKHMVSLRGSSAREITRDALLDKVSQEREIRHFARRAAAAALFVQRVWRRYYMTKKVALQLREEWELSLANGFGSMSKTWISIVIVRPFLFFIDHLSLKQRKIQAQDVRCTSSCFMSLLQSITSVDSNKNFNSLATGSTEERRVWGYQTRKLITLCSFMLEVFDSSSASKDMATATSLVLRLIISLTDLNCWKFISDQNRIHADGAVKDLVCFMGSRESGVYRAIGKYISSLDTPSERQSLTDDKFLITASAVTLALRPFQADTIDSEDSDTAAMQFCTYILPVPWLIQRIPVLLLPALRHTTVVTPCFRTLQMFHKKILMEYSEINRSRSSSVINAISQAGSALSNIICLVTATANNSTNFTDYVHLVSYVEVINILAEEFEVDLRLYADSCSFFDGEDLTFGSLRYMDLLKPVTMQWHLASLMASVKRGSSDLTDPLSTTSGKRSLVGLELCDVARFYSHMIRIYSMLNTTVGSLPVLNILSFTPGFLLNIWDRLEKLVFPANSQASKGSICIDLVSQKRNDGAFDKKSKQFVKDGGAKWITMLQRITAKRKSDPDHVEFVSKQVSGLDDEDIIDSWDVEPMRSASASISKDTSFLLHLFCATYAHLLLVLDDIEFYERQVPFTLEQQRRIASMLNTLVYNSMLHSNGQLDKFLMDAAVKCLQMLYERDCRHQFCPPSLWLAPARVSRPPIAAAARLHLAARPDDYSPTTSVGSFITTIPHVYPFEERVQIFREFIKMDKVSRKMAGELTGPSEQSTEVVVRRGHIVEDGFRQLNSLGSKLKSSIHVSFIGECGLPEAGLDYGGLSKEFLTDIAKEAFSPDYGLFTQTVTTERLLIPNTAAIFQDNGIQMIEFLGRIVGKSLYEGLLLDYSFSRAFVQKLLGRYSFLDELSTLDPELYKNLIYLKHYDGDIKELSLDFTVTEESLGKLHVIELKPGGKDTSVTDENKLQYIHAMADYKLNRQILALSNAFYRGLTDLISPSWLGLFNASEFNQLLSGGNHDFDVDDLRDNTQYTGGYTEGSRTVKLFWEVLSGLEPKERCMLLKFVTSCSRAPLLGFKYLQPIFTIHKVACDTPLWAAIGGHDVERLPSASTCYNTLKLPTYKRASTLKAKLLYAINSNAGFELS